MTDGGPTPYGVSANIVPWIEVPVLRHQKIEHGNPLEIPVGVSAASCTRRDIPIAQLPPHIPNMRGPIASQRFAARHSTLGELQKTRRAACEPIPSGCLLRNRWQQRSAERLGSTKGTLFSSASASELRPDCLFLWRTSLPSQPNSFPASSIVDLQNCQPVSQLVFHFDRTKDICINSG